MRDAADRRREARAGQARADIGASVRRGLLFGAALMALVLPLALHPGRQGAVADQGGAATTVTSVAKPAARRADFGQQSVSPDARQLADWVADSRDHADSAFVIVDKKHATVHVFDAAARLRGSTPVLLGAAAGDDSVAGIGARAIADVKPHERITPAGRFIAERGHNALGDDVIWVDYDAAVSMHRVRTTDRRERRLERLASPGVDDNRISYGCINVPVAFYDALLRPLFATQRALVYVLPEVRTVQQVFGSYDVAAAPGRGAD